MNRLYALNYNEYKIRLLKISLAAISVASGNFPSNATTLATTSDTNMFLYKKPPEGGFRFIH